MFKKPTKQDVLRISLGHNGPVTVHSMQGDEPGGMLRGTIVLDCPNDLRIKALTLKFEGRAKVMWSEDGQQFRDERQLIQHEWHFLPSLPYNKAHHLKGKHTYHFSLPLPVDLPSSLNEDRATINYHLKAVAERPAFSTNFVCKRSINVQREVEPTPALLRAVASARTASSFSYRVQLDQHMYSPGAVVPLGVQVHTTCKVQSFVCVLKNYVTLVTARHACRFSHILAYLRDDHFGPRDTHASSSDIILKTEQLKIPQDIVADTHTELLRVRHKLKISFMLIKQDGTAAQVKATIPIIVAHLFEPETAQIVPPTYEEANSLSTTYLAQLNRVPSYSSIATQTDIPHRFSRQSLLPAYDSIPSS